jgi:hypothetical protein
MRKQTSNITALAVLLGLSSAPVSQALADDGRPLMISFAGGFLQNLQQAQVDMMGMPTGEVESRSLVIVKGRGTLGPVDIMAVTFSGPPISETECSEGLVKVADIIENNLVLTFNDLSLLYGNGTGVVCLDPLNPTAFPVAEITGTWDGGTGRFAHVAGDWSISFDVAERVGSATQFIAENGVIRGHINGGGHRRRK